MKTTFPYSEGKAIADSLVELLNPFVERLEIAGSIRRNKETIGDIELVAIPKPYKTGLFEDGLARVVNQWPRLKGELEYGVCKYTQRVLPQGINLDLFFATKINWGLIFLIRTGDWQFSKKFIGLLLPQKGYKSEGGYLKDSYNRIVQTPEEIDLFKFAGIEYIQPENRDIFSF